MTRSPDWQAGFELGRSGKPHVLYADHVSDDYIDGYVHGRAEAECARASIKIDRNVGLGIRRMLRALGWTR